MKQRAAGDVERDHHAIALGDVGDLGADLLDDAHRLVAEDVALAHERAEDLVEVQVGAADAGRRDADDRVGRVFDARVGDVVDADVGAVGVAPGVVSRLLSTHHASRSLAAAFALAAAGWIWFGWVEKPYGISRAGLILYTGIGAAGFVRGWILGIRIGSNMRPSRAANVSFRSTR